MKKLFCLFCVISISLSFADSIIYGSAAHTLGKVITNEDKWEFSITGINEADLAIFTNEGTQQEIKQGDVLRLSPMISFDYGFSFSGGADFDVVYVITAVKKNKPDAFPGNPKCVLIVTAKSPAVPEVSLSNFQGATCSVSDTIKSAGTLTLSTN